MNLIWKIPAAVIIALVMWLAHPQLIIKVIDRWFDEDRFEAYMLYYSALVLAVIGLISLFI